MQIEPKFQIGSLVKILPSWANDRFRDRGVSRRVEGLAWDTQSACFSYALEGTAIRFEELELALAPVDDEAQP